MDMKKMYQLPAINVLQLEACKILSGSDGTGVYTDDPQKPGNALSRRRNDSWDESWDDEEEDI